VIVYVRFVTSVKHCDAALLYISLPFSFELITYLVLLAYLFLIHVNSTIPHYSIFTLRSMARFASTLNSARVKVSSGLICNDPTAAPILASALRA